MLDDIFRAIENLARSFQERLSVRTVYGDPITAGSVTIVPVARVTFGFGGGGGGGGGPLEREEGTVGGGSGGGGGGGGGGAVVPIGYIEITDGDSRWVPLEKPRSEVALRALTAALTSLPGSGRKGLLGRLFLAAAVQGLMGRLSDLKPPSMPEGFRFRRSAAE
jgi:uncharacterized spore protein YtfJ